MCFATWVAHQYYHRRIKARGFQPNAFSVPNLPTRHLRILKPHSRRPVLIFKKKKKKWQPPSARMKICLSAVVHVAYYFCFDPDLLTPLLVFCCCISSLSRKFLPSCSLPFHRSKNTTRLIFLGLIIITKETPMINLFKSVINRLCEMSVHGNIDSVI